MSNLTFGRTSKGEQIQIFTWHNVNIRGVDEVSMRATVYEPKCVRTGYASVTWGANEPIKTRDAALAKVRSEAIAKVDA